LELGNGPSLGSRNSRISQQTSNGIFLSRGPRGRFPRGPRFLRLGPVGWLSQGKERPKRARGVSKGLPSGWSFRLLGPYLSAKVSKAGAGGPIGKLVPLFLSTKRTNFSGAGAQRGPKKFHFCGKNPTFRVFPRFQRGLVPENF